MACILEFGRRRAQQLAQNGDHKRALASFRAAGDEAEAAKMQAKITAIEHAKTMEQNGLYKRAADILLRSGLDKEARELAERLEKKKSPEALHAAASIHATNERPDLMHAALEKLLEHDHKGMYYAALVIADTNQEGARYFADVLSEKPQERKSDGKKMEDARTYFAVRTKDDVRTMIRAHVSMIGWGMSWPIRFYHALRIYQGLNDNEGVERCLDTLAKEMKRTGSQEYYFYALLAVRGEDALPLREIEVGNKREDDELNIISRVILITSGADALIRFTDSLDKDKKERYARYCEILFREPITENMADEEVLKVIRRKHEARAALVPHEYVKLTRIGELLRTGTFAAAKEAERLMRTLDANFMTRHFDLDKTRRIRSSILRRCADAAYAETGNLKAQVYAGSFYEAQREVAKAVACAENLMHLGAHREAEDLLVRTARHMAKGMAEEIASQFTETKPLVALSMYEAAKNKGAYMEVAERLLDSEQPLGIVEKIAWVISAHAGRTPLMQKALGKLESFGQEGKDSADGIRREMHVGTAFVAH